MNFVSLMGMFPVETSTNKLPPLNGTTLDVKILVDKFYSYILELMD